MHSGAYVHALKWQCYVFVITENKVQETFRELLCFCFIQMKPDVEIYFSDITDTMKKLIKVILQPLLL